jgi:hypothetical protein
VFPEHWDAVKEDLPDETVAFANLFAADCAALTQEDFRKFHEKLTLPKANKDKLYKLVPKQYHSLIDLWDPQEAEAIPASKPRVDYKIRTIDGSGPTHKKAYGLSQEEMRALKAYIDAELKKGFIRPSNLPYAAPVLVVKKPGGRLRICIDY